jgi:hypothetical protein
MVLIRLADHNDDIEMGPREGAARRSERAPAGDAVQAAVDVPESRHRFDGDRDILECAHDHVESGDPLGGELRPRPDET